MLCDKEHLTAALLNEKYYFAECTSVFMAGGKNESEKNRGGGCRGVRVEDLLKVLTGNLEIKRFDGIWPREPLSFGTVYGPD